MPSARAAVGREAPAKPPLSELRQCPDFGLVKPAEGRGLARHRRDRRGLPAVMAVASGVVA